MGNIFRSETNYLQLIKLKQRMLGEMRVAAILALKKNVPMLFEANNCTVLTSVSAVSSFKEYRIYAVKKKRIKI